jgi:hypothetical protein
MNMRLVDDARSNVLVLFGGDGQSRYLAETWLYDLKTRSWPQSKALANPEARAGHFTVYDSGIGWVLVGVVYHRGDLTDNVGLRRGARQLAQTRCPSAYRRLHFRGYCAGKTAACARCQHGRAEDRSTCNVLYSVPTTYGFRIDASPAAVKHDPITKCAPQSVGMPNDLTAVPRNQCMLPGTPRCLSVGHRPTLSSARS